MLPDKDLDWHELKADGSEGHGSEGPELGLEAIGDARVTRALAIDHQGTRLAQGCGSSDRTLARRHPDANIVAIVNDEEYAVRALPN